MSYLFPEHSEEWRKQIVSDLEEKLKTEIDLREKFQPWIELKKVTEQMKEYHPRKDKINEDEKWKEYVKVLVQMEELTRTSEDISDEQTSQRCNACTTYIGEGAKSCMAIGLFDVLNRCKDQLKILAENQNFNDETHFENTLN
ncbi:hypothetical protein RFI_26697, partial [Reticulomyxa filosa]